MVGQFLVFARTVTELSSTGTRPKRTTMAASTLQSRTPSLRLAAPASLSRRAVLRPSSLAATTRVVPKFPMMGTPRGTHLVVIWFLIMRYQLYLASTLVREQRPDCKHRRYWRVVGHFCLWWRAHLADFYVYVYNYYDAHKQLIQHYHVADDNVDIRCPDRR